MSTNFNARIGIFGSDFSGGAFASVQKNAAKTAAKIASMQTGMRNFASGFAPISLAAGFGLKQIYDGAVELSGSQADLNKVWGGSQEQLKGMNNWIKQNSVALNQNRSEMTSAAANATEAGIAQQDLSNFLKISAESATAFGLSADNVSTSLAKVKAGTGLSMAGIADLSNVVNHLSNNVGANGGQLLDYAKRTLPDFMSKTNIAAAEATAFGAALIAAGAAPEVASTGTRAFVRELTKGSAASAKQQGAWKKLGTSSKEVAARMQKDATGTISSIIKALGKVPDAEKGGLLNSLLGDEGSRALMPLLKNPELLATVFGLVADEADRANSTTDEFGTKMGSLFGQSEKLGNSFRSMWQDMGGSNSGAISKIVSFATDAIEGFRSLSPEAQQTSAAILGVAAAAAPLAMAASFFVGPWVKGFGLVIAGAAKLRTAFIGASAGAAMLSSVGGGAGLFGGILARIGPLVAALGTITAPFVAIGAAVAATALVIYRYWTPISQFFAGIGDVVGGALSGIASAVASFAGQKILDFGEWLGIDPAVITEKFNAVKSAISDFGSSATQMLSDAFQGTKSFLSDLFTGGDYSGEAAAQFRKAGQDAANAFMTFMSELPGKITNMMLDLGRRIATALNNLLSVAYENIKSYLFSGQSEQELTNNYTAGPLATRTANVETVRSIGGANPTGRIKLKGPVTATMDTASKVKTDITIKVNGGQVTNISSSGGNAEPGDVGRQELE